MVRDDFMFRFFSTQGPLSIVPGQGQARLYENNATEGDEFIATDYSASGTNAAYS